MTTTLVLKCKYQLWVFSMYKMSLSFLWWWQKHQFDYQVFSWCNLHLQFWKITSGFTLAEWWEVGDYHIIFWSVMSNAKFSIKSPDQFLCICLIHVAPTNLATSKWNSYKKNTNGILLLKSVFDITNQKTIW